MELLTRLEQIREALPAGTTAYLVGGAVRDMLLGRPTHDLDFVLPADALRTSRRVADALNAAFYPLDEERDTGRVVEIKPDGSRQVIDFSVLRGPDLESDLRARDFTVNAIALDLRAPQSLIDPLGGAADLYAKQLRACSPSSFVEDPLRVVRGVRLAAAFGFRILPETRHQMGQAVPGLERISPERLRDELFRMMGGPQPWTAIRALDLLGALPYILPELPALKGVAQTPPHVHDVWSHTLSALQKLDSLLSLLSPHPDPEGGAYAHSLATGLAVMRLGRYREQIHAHLGSELIPDRSLRALLFLAALYHDTGKPETRQVDAQGRARFFEHEQAGAKIVAARARALRLSAAESDRLKKIVQHHLRPVLLAQNDQPPTRRAIYRFFRDTALAGVDICLLSLADVLATYEAGLPQEVWARHLDVVRALLEAWWERPGESVAPPSLIDGRDLMDALHLKPGPQVGRLLEAIREAQASGQVNSREEAMALAASLYQG
jgi:putative nucleotidyltransferase with HDIG domain